MILKRKVKVTYIEKDIDYKALSEVLAIKQLEEQENEKGTNSIK